MADGAASTAAPPTAHEILAATAAGRMSAVEALELCLAQIAAHDATIGAFAHLDADQAREEASALDARRKAGAPLGPLHGLPVAVKDIIDVAGLPCERGTVLDAGRRPEADATVVRRLRRLGAVILGKTVTAELASVGPGKTRNPHDTSRTPGGSSSGSAASVAAGMAPFALGTQTMGSVIRPASFCGVFGFKPSFGAIPRTGIMADAPSLDHVGVFARTLADLTLAQHLMGGDGSDPDAGIDPGPLDVTAMAEPPLRPVLAFTGTAAWERAEAATREAFVELAEAIGGPVDQIPLPGEYERALDDTMTLMSAEMAHELGGYVERGRKKLHPGFVELIEAGRKVAAVDYLEARRWQGRLRAGLDRVFDRYDAIITPAAPGEAPGLETTGDASFCALWSLTGLPAVNLPLMTGPAGLPLGVQLVGRHGDDARLLRTANWLVRHLGFDGETQ